MCTTPSRGSSTVGVTKWRSWRTRRALGTWRSTPSTFAREIGILSSAAEYESNYLAILQVCQRTGARVEIVPDDPSGQVSVEALEAMLDDRVKLISLTHVPTNGGLVNPAAAVGAIARRHGIPFLLDACQSAGQLPLDVELIGCDVLTGTGRKYLRGPRGTGFLYVRRSLIEQLQPPFIDLQAAEWVSRDAYRLRPDARRFETWETNYAAKIGLGVAVDYALAWGLESIWQRIRHLGEQLRSVSRTCRTSRCATSGRSGAGSCRSRMPAIAATEIQAELSGSRHQCLGIAAALYPDRYGTTRTGRGRPCIRPLLQHGARAGPVVRSTRAAALSWADPGESRLRAATTMAAPVNEPGGHRRGDTNHGRSRVQRDLGGLRRRQSVRRAPARPSIDGRAGASSPSSPSRPGS